MVRMAFLCFDWDYEVISQYYSGMEAFVRETPGLEVVIFSAFGHYHQLFDADAGTFEVFELCDLARYDGLVVQGNRTWPPAMRQQVVDEARRLGIPAVSINYDLQGACDVGTDNYDAMRGLVEQVLDDRGCVRPAFVNGLASSVEAQARARAYQDVCAERGLSQALFYQATWQIEDGRALARRLLEEGAELPEVFFCCNDDLAIGVQETLAAGGVRIPEDVMITGFDNREISRTVSPRMTTVDRDYATIGRTALATLLVLIDGEELPEKIGSPARYELRESCRYESADESDGDDDLYSLGNTLKRFYEVLNNFQATIYGANSLRAIVSACERFAPYLRCPHAYLTINEAYLQLDRTQPPTSYHPISHLMSWSGEGERPTPDERHIYLSYPAKDVLPQELMGPGLYVVYPVRRGDVCIGTVVTEGLSPIMQYGFLTFCLTLLAAGFTGTRTMEQLREANARLDDLYVHDELTGLHNRFGLERYGAIVYEHLLRDFGRAYFTFVDIDNMKGINDGLGHEQGDAAICDAADVIRRGTAGENAFAMRYGGDEFLVISRRDLIPKLEEQLDLLKRSVERPYDLGLSIGCSEVSADEGLGIEAAIRRADDRMYDIKRERKLRRG